MVTLFAVVDVIVLVLLLTRVLRAFWKALPKGAGSILLVILVAVPLVCFATVSLTVFVSIVTTFTVIGRLIASLFLVGMLTLLRITWADRPSGVS
jgi:hypothetical protein